MSDFFSSPNETKPRRFPWVASLLGAGLAISLGANMFQHSDTVNLRQEVKGMQREMASLREIVANSDRNLLQTLETLRGEFDNAQRSTAVDLGKAKEAARKQAELVASRLSKTQEEQRRALADQIDRMKAANEATSVSLSNRLTDISSDVGSVKTQVASTRTDVDKTITDLRRVTGDMGVMSGLIATNSKELAALRELGDRNYYEFKIPKNKIAAKIADVQILVKKTDPRRNRFTLEVIADDKRVEKKDRTINEPIQFYVLSKARQPYELVINEVTSNQVVGYISTPKLRLARGN